MLCWQREQLVKFSDFYFFLNTEYFHCLECFVVTKVAYYLFSLESNSVCNTYSRKIFLMKKKGKDKCILVKGVPPSSLQLHFRYWKPAIRSV